MSTKRHKRKAKAKKIKRALFTRKKTRKTTCNIRTTIKDRKSLYRKRCVYKKKLRQNGSIKSNFVMPQINHECMDANFPEIVKKQSSSDDDNSFGSHQLNHWISENDSSSLSSGSGCNLDSDSLYSLESDSFEDLMYNWLFNEKYVKDDTSNTTIGCLMRITVPSLKDTEDVFIKDEDISNIAILGNVDMTNFEDKDEDIDIKYEIKEEDSQTLNILPFVGTA